MRSMILTVCVLAAACGDSVVKSPSEPSGVARSTASANAAVPLPFNGTFARRSSAVTNCPPTCPPTTLRITAAAEGTATHLGRFTADSVDIVDIAANTGTGTFDMTAANGDRIVTTTVGVENEFVPPNRSHVTLSATIIGGTGRFAGSTGTLTISFAETIDFASGTATASGTIEGHMVMRN